MDANETDTRPAWRKWLPFFGSSLVNRWWAGAAAGPILAWATYGLAGHRAAAAIARKWGPQIVRAGDGKFSDAALFLQHRGYEAAWLLSWTAVLALVMLGLGALWAQRLKPGRRWIAWAACGFAGVNLWIPLAAGTALFWCLFWHGKGQTDNFTQFNLKLVLLQESPAPLKVVIGGSSQAHAELDPRRLNQRLGPEIYTTELHFPGNRGYDFLSLERKLGRRQAQIIVCYLSEMSFFGDGLSYGFPSFFTFGELPQFLRLGGKPQWGPREFGYGLLGAALPVFRLREPLARLLLGEELLELPERQENSAREPDLRQRAHEAASGYRADAQTQFQMAAFETFVARCREHHRRVVLCCGQLNPLLGNAIAPELRPRMVAFLKELAARYDNTLLLEGAALPAQTEADYDDLTHVNRAAQTRFTECIGQVIEELAKRRD